jgi:hypothetical protein
VPGNHRGILREFSAHISQLLAAGHIGSEAVVEYRGRRIFPLRILLALRAGTVQRNVGAELTQDFTVISGHAPPGRSQ